MAAMIMAVAVVVSVLDAFPASPPAVRSALGAAFSTTLLLILQ